MTSISFISFVKTGKGLNFSSVPLILLSQCLVLSFTKSTVKDDLFDYTFLFCRLQDNIRRTDILQNIYFMVWVFNFVKSSGPLHI